MDSQPFLACWLLFAVEPTDRALAGWCPVGPALGFKREADATAYLRYHQGYGSAMLAGPVVSGL